MRGGTTLLISFAVAASGCGGSDSTSIEATPDVSSAAVSEAETTVASGQSSSSESAVSTSSSEPTSTSADPSTTAPAACPTPELPAGNSTAPMSVDLDADGAADTAYMVSGPAGWQLVVELGGGGAGGGAVVSALVGTNDFDEPEVLGGADLDGDGIDELAVLVANGAYVGLVSFVRVRECSAIQLAFEDDSPAIFASGASAGGGEALVCNGDGTLDRYFFSWLPGDDDETVEYEAGFQPFRIEGDVVISLPGDGAGLTEDEIADIDLFDCLGLELVQ